MSFSDKDEGAMVQCVIEHMERGYGRDQAIHLCRQIREQFKGNAPSMSEEHVVGLLKDVKLPIDQREVNTSLVTCFSHLSV